MLFRKREMQVTYIKAKQLEKWIPIVLKREIGFDYSVQTNLSDSRNLINLSFEETEMTEESFDALVKVFGYSSYDFCDSLIPKIIEMTSKRKVRRYVYDYKIFVDDLDGFYLIRKRKGRMKIV